jgi:hypothetical protein
LFIDDSHPVPLYTPTGFDIVTKAAGKDFESVSINKLPSLVGRCFTFFKFLDMLVKIAIQAFSDPYFSKNRF